MALLERPPVVDADAEALFKEARQRRRRRWLVGTCMVLVAASIAALVGLASQSPGKPTPSAPPKPRVSTPTQRPLINVRAFSGLGQLAFVSRNVLWVLDGETNTLHQVVLPRGVAPTSPTFSPDGQWLAFLTGSTPGRRGSLWIAHSDGTGVRRVPGLVLGDAFGWSPHSDLYAVAAGPLSTRVPFGQPTTVRLVSPSGSSHTLATAPAIIGAAWSPDGASLAVSTINHNFIPSLNSYTVDGDRSTAWNDDPNSRQFFVVPAGWWNDWGVVYTVIDNGAVPDGEGSFEDAALYSLAGPDATPHFIGETLTNDSDGPPSATNTGLLTFVSDAGQDPRTPWNGKQVDVCSPALLSCLAVPAPAGDVTEDPVWSPSSSMLAYVAAPSLNTDEFLAPAVSSWYGSHLLELYNPDTHSASPDEAAPGSAVPSWSASGKSLIYEADNGLWVLPNPAVEPIEVASPLFAQTTSPLSGPGIPSYYGEIDWSQQFGWSKEAPQTQCYVVCNAA
jgi:dipeptidyl aminopeptidase/acylaminoacyl peptidase